MGVGLKEIAGVARPLEAAECGAVVAVFGVGVPSFSTADGASAEFGTRALLVKTLSSSFKREIFGLLSLIGPFYDEYL